MSIEIDKMPARALECLSRWITYPQLFPVLSSFIHGSNMMQVFGLQRSAACG